MTTKPMPLALILSLLLSACGGAPEGDDHRDRAGPAQANAEASSGDDAHDHAGGQAFGEGAHEGEGRDDERTTIAARIAEESGIRVAPVQAGVIADEHQVQGLLTPVEGRVASVVARFPGPIRGLAANVGDRVRAGQPLATIESNLSLSDYSVAAPISGTVLARNASIGGLAGEGTVLFEIADLSTLWVDLHVFGADADHLGPGSAVTITRLGDGATARTMIERVLPGTATASQSTVARALLDNADGLWRPGSAVRADVTVARQPVERMVPVTALQRMDGRDVVFVREDETYMARTVALGKRDAQRVEVLSGVVAGEQVVVEQSYLVKADIEKAGASHEH